MLSNNSFPTFDDWPCDYRFHYLNPQCKTLFNALVMSLCVRWCKYESSLLRYVCECARVGMCVSVSKLMGSHIGWEVGLWTMCDIRYMIIINYNHT